MAEAASGAKILTGSMPPDNGIAMTGQASTEDVYLDLGSDERMTVVCNGKNTDQQTVINQLDAIHYALTRRFDFPSGDGWKIYAIRTMASPRLLGRERNSQWLYGSSLEIKINTKGLIKK